MKKSVKYVYVPFLVVLTLISVLLISIECEAALLSYSFTGQVSVIGGPPDIPNPEDLLTGIIEIGNPFNGILTYDAGLTDSNPSPSFGEYFLPAPSGISVSINALNFSTRFTDDVTLSPFLRADINIDSMNPRVVIHCFSVLGIMLLHPPLKSGLKLP